jgi:hypothetical protein
MPIFNVPYAEIRTQVARLIQDLVASGTVINPTMTTINASTLVQQRTDQLKGNWLYFNGGGLSQLERPIGAFAVISAPAPGSGGRIEVIESFVNSVGSPAAPSTNTTFEVYRRIQPASYNEAILRNIRRVASKMLVPVFDHAVVLNTRIRNGTFQYFTAGITLAPDDWTTSGAGTLARRNGPGAETYPNIPHSVRLINTNSNPFSIFQDIFPAGPLAGEQFTARATVYCETAARVRIQVTDGVNTFNSEYHDGQGDNELEITGESIGADPTRVRLDLRIETGGVINATWKKAGIVVGDTVYEHELPTNLMWLERIFVEGDTDGNFSEEIPGRYWYIDNSQSTPRLVFIKGLFEPTFGKVLRVIGQGHAGVPSAEIDNLEVDPQYVVYRTAEELLAQLPWGEQDRKNWRDKHLTNLRAADALEKRLSTRVRAGSKQVREI